MTLYIIGIGLSDAKDTTLRGLEAIKKCEKIYLENYTSQLQCPVGELEAVYGKQIILADRELVEKQAGETILADAQSGDTAFLVIGDCLGATTHTDILLRAHEKKIPVKLINNTSIMNAIGNIGLELYKFGKTTSIVFPEPNFAPDSFYKIIQENKSINAHTLCLLDIKMAEQPPRFMTVKDALQILLGIEAKKEQGIITQETKVIGCARIGGKDSVVKYGTVQEVMQHDFGAPLHCLIIPGPLHFKEEEMLNTF